MNDLFSKRLKIASKYLSGFYKAPHYETIKKLADTLDVEPSFFTDPYYSLPQEKPIDEMVQESGHIEAVKALKSALDTKNDMIQLLRGEISYLKKRLQEHEDGRKRAE